MSVEAGDVDEAAARIAGRVRRTPVMDVEVGDVRVALKLELLQLTGSFKPRGAFNRVLSEPAIPDAGLIAASGGNHGLAVAYVGRSLGIPTEIFVPEVTAAAKTDRIEALGATLVVAGALYQDALVASRSRAAETGALEVHAYDHGATVAGQGTMASELEGQIPDVETLLIAVGGGGLIGGAAAWFGGRVRLLGVEPVTSAACHAALAAGRPVEVEVSGVAADSLGARSVGAVPFESIKAGVDDVVLVDDGAIRAAQRWLWDSVRLVAEPGGATALAAVLTGAYHPTPHERLAVVVCGGNTDPASVAG